MQHYTENNVGPKRWMKLLAQSQSHAYIVQEKLRLKPTSDDR